MKEQSRIPTSKISRAQRFAGTGIKVGGNYLKYFAKKVFTGSDDKDQLDEENADDIYSLLSTLKGSALKAAQMLSMDQNLLPGAYARKFQMAQYSAPPLSYPLVVRTFQKYFDQSPTEMFEDFSKHAINAASIGQVHKAKIGDQLYAIKVQYPGVADSIHSDLQMAKPLAARIMQVPAKDLDHYMEELEEKLTEETDYNLELKRSQEISEACAHLPGLVFPKYYPVLSCERVLTMEWIDATHLSEWIKTNPSQKERNKIGQYLWDFYQFQIHEFKRVHADPHPGNFLINDAGELCIIDFGCVKDIPLDFYEKYIQLFAINDNDTFEDKERLFSELEFFFDNDTSELKEMLMERFVEMITLMSRPFRHEHFDFSDHSYFESIYELAETLQADKELKRANTARGSKHFIYLNRTYFGLYGLLHELGAKVKIEPLLATVN